MNEQLMEDAQVSRTDQPHQYHGFGGSNIAFDNHLMCSGQMNICSTFNNAAAHDLVFDHLRKIDNYE